MITGLLMCMVQHSALQSQGCLPRSPDIELALMTVCNSFLPSSVVE